MTKGRATEEAFDALHRQLAENFLEVLEKGVKTVKVDEDGNETTTFEKPSPSMFNVIRQFLKDNGIDCVPTSTNPLGELARSLPEFGADGEVVDRKH